MNSHFCIIVLHVAKVDSCMVALDLIFEILTIVIYKYCCRQMLVDCFRQCFIFYNYSNVPELFKVVSWGSSLVPPQIFSLKLTLTLLKEDLSEKCLVLSSNESADEG